MNLKNILPVKKLDPLQIFAIHFHLNDILKIKEAQ